MAEYSHEETNDQFPVSIDLGKAMNDGAMVKPAGDGPKNKKYYPTLYISDAEGLDKLPEEGCALIKYKRKSVTVRKDDSGKTSASAELEIQSICLPDDDSSDEGEEDGGMGDLVDKMAEGAGIDTGKKKSPVVEEDDDENEESDE